MMSPHLKGPLATLKQYDSLIDSIWPHYWFHMTPLLFPYDPLIDFIWLPYWFHMTPLLIPYDPLIDSIWSPYWFHMTPLLIPYDPLINSIWPPYWFHMTHLLILVAAMGKCKQINRSLISSVATSYYLFMDSWSCGIWSSAFVVVSKLGGVMCI